jgi:membrane-bound lytic murein transglycosylase B
MRLSELMKLNDIKDKDELMAGKKIKINKKSNIYFIGTENFVAITKYNYSHFYAMVVYNLARELGL